MGMYVQENILKSNGIVNTLLIIKAGTIVHKYFIFEHFSLYKIRNSWSIIVNSNGKKKRRKTSFPVKFHCFEGVRVILSPRFSVHMNLFFTPWLLFDCDCGP